MKRSLLLLSALLLSAACAGEEEEGRFHDSLCDVAFINEDFLEDALDADWRERSVGAGSFALTHRGSGADKQGWLDLSTSSGDLSSADRSAYGLMHVAPSEGFRLRLQVASAPTSSDQLVGLVGESDEDTLVAFTLRGTGGQARPELVGYDAGAEAFRADGEARSGEDLLLVLVHDRDEWIASLGETELGRGTLPMPGSSFDVGIVIGSPGGSEATARVEWVEACPYYRDRP